MPSSFELTANLFITVLALRPLLWPLRTTTGPNSTQLHFEIWKTVLFYFLLRFHVPRNAASLFIWLQKTRGNSMRTEPLYMFKTHRTRQTSFKLKNTRADRSWNKLPEKLGGIFESPALSNKIPDGNFLDTITPA